MCSAFPGNSGVGLPSTQVSCLPPKPGAATRGMLSPASAAPRVCRWAVSLPGMAG
ncbi:hypothetical protein [Rhodanobacter lindaniclasticus]